VGYKYFNFTETNGKENLKLSLRLIPEGVDGKILVMVDRPWESQGGKQIGSLELTSHMVQESTALTIDLPELGSLTGKHAIYFKFVSDTKDKSICKLEDFQFQY
jgi:hypothetical protein